MKRKICVVTGTRAEYGLLRWVMEGIRNSESLKLQVIATGMHLSPEFGLTYREIISDGFKIDRKIEMLVSSDTPAGLAKSMGLGLIGMGDALEQLKPDLLLVLGDRFEILAAVAAAAVARIPVAHLHGGEATEGAFDDAMRHAITKLSHLHFAAAPEYAARIVQMGEQPDRVFDVGGLGVDALGKIELLDRPALEESLGLELGQRSLLVTYHPITLDAGSSSAQMSELLAALAPLDSTRLIFTMPNADTEGRALFGLIERFVAEHPNANSFVSLGHRRYLSCVRYTDGVIGNSSSGLTEVPSFGKGTVNIGARQRGRLRAESVIDCEPDRVSISAAIDRLYSADFQASLDTARNPYGTGGASERIVAELERVSLDGIVKKRFHDIDVTAASHA